MSHTDILFSTLSLFSSLKKLFVALTVVFMDNVWAIHVSVLLDGKAPDARWRPVVNVVKANVSMEAAFVKKASMASIAALTLVVLIVILGENVETWLTKTKNPSMSEYWFGKVIFKLFGKKVSLKSAHWTLNERRVGRGLL